MIFNFTDTQKQIDAIQSTSKSTLSTAGWYRVAEYVGGDISQVRGGMAYSCVISIKRSYTTTNNEYHRILFNAVYNNQSFLSQIALCNKQLITKIRLAVDETNRKAYIEMCYAESYQNRFYIEISSPSDYISVWKAITPTLTEETVDGVTVTTTYDIPANASPVTDLDLANYLPLSGGKDITNRLNMVVEGSNPATFTYKNDLHAVQVGIGSEGDFVAWDYTLNEALWRIKPNGTKTFNGTASGNLKLDGGGTVKSDSTVPIRVNSTNTQGMTLIDFQRDGASQGYLGFSGADNPVFYSATKGNKSLLHTGNSAKVHIGTSAPSDTSAVWIDTSA